MTMTVKDAKSIKSNISKIEAASAAVIGIITIDLLCKAANIDITKAIRNNIRPIVAATAIFFLVASIITKKDAENKIQWAINKCDEENKGKKNTEKNKHSAQGLREHLHYTTTLLNKLYTNIGDAGAVVVLAVGAFELLEKVQHVMTR